MGKVKFGLVLAALSYVLLWLAGCSSGYAPVADRSISQNRHKNTIGSAAIKGGQARTYRVKKGDTLYSIAWRYGKDYRKLAKINGIGPDYRIFTGQVIRFTASKKDQSGKPVARPNNDEVVATKSDTALIPRHKERLKQNTDKKTDSRANKSSQPITNGSSPKKEATVSKPIKQSIVTRPPKKIRWRWPAKGRVITGFLSKKNSNRGINIAGKQGDPVYAAASGEVVFAGSGLLGYGKLIIINHNQTFLSAYAHNHRILVKESEHVKVGDRIAEVGRSGTTRSMLHFEIRKDGKPINPLKFLPKR